jgi:hypothetical protein
VHQDREAAVAEGTVEIGAEHDTIAHGDGDGSVDADGRLRGKHEDRRAERGGTR